MTRHTVTSAVALLAIVATLTLTAATEAADRHGLEKGDVQLQSAGPIAFGPDGILFVGDTKAAKLVALGTGDTSGDANDAAINVANLEQAIAKALGADAASVSIADLAVNPRSGAAYLSVTAAGKPAIVRASPAGKVTALNLAAINHSKLALADAPEDKVIQRGRRKKNLRNDSITDLVYTDATLMVSGAASGNAPAAIREYAFPFVKSDRGSNVVIYHAAHGREENDAVPRVMVPFVVDGEPSLLAGFICTPLVQFPINGIAPGKPVRGKTVAELGNRNKPLAMIVYEKDNQRYLLIANSARGVMKVSTKDIKDQPGLKEKVSRGESAGLPYDTISTLKNVALLDRLNDDHALLLIKTDAGPHALKTIPLP